MARDILLSEIDPDPDQPRRWFDPAALAELAQSLDASGLAVPILVRPVAGRFVIVHGERRYRAADILGWQTIAAEIRELTAGDAALLALVENVQRADLLPLEEARAYAAILAGGDMTQAELGERVGKSQSYIAGKLRLLKLPGPVQAMLEDGRITEGHAKQILKVNGLVDTEARQLELAEFAQGRTVKQAANFADYLLLDSEAAHFGDLIRLLGKAERGEFDIGDGVRQAEIVTEVERRAGALLFHGRRWWEDDGHGGVVGWLFDDASLEALELVAASDDVLRAARGVDGLTFWLHMVNHPGRWERAIKQVPVRGGISRGQWFVAVYDAMQAAGATATAYS